jgi:hypothetical protein
MIIRGNKLAIRIHYPRYALSQCEPHHFRRVVVKLTDIKKSLASSRRVVRLAVHLNATRKTRAVGDKRRRLARRDGMPSYVIFIFYLAMS